MKDSENENITISIILHPQDQDIVFPFRDNMGLSTTAAIRVIIRQWAQFKGAQLPMQFSQEAT